MFGHKQYCKKWLSLNTKGTAITVKENQFKWWKLTNKTGHLWETNPSFPTNAQFCL